MIEDKRFIQQKSTGDSVLFLLFPSARLVQYVKMVLSLGAHETRTESGTNTTDVR